MTANHSTMTGPKSRPTLCVPNRCARNSTVKMATPIGSTASWTPGDTTLMPSTAESTEMAGVMTLSPKNRAAPTMPSRTPMATTRLAETRCRIKAASAMMPPSGLAGLIGTVCRLPRVGGPGTSGRRPSLHVP